MAACSFRDFATPTGDLTIDKSVEADRGLGLMTRRKQERDERIAAEPQFNEFIRREQWLVAELEKQQQARNANEPPF